MYCYFLIMCSYRRYANRAKNIKNKPKINEDPKDAMLREYQEQIKALKEQLEATQRGVMLDDSGRQVGRVQVRLGFSLVMMDLRCEQVMVHNAQKEIVEKIVEREVIKEVKVHVGISDKEMEVKQYPDLKTTFNTDLHFLPCAI